MMAVRLLTALILVELMRCTSSLDNGNRLERLMNTLERLVTHYKKTNRDLNIDGLYGLRVIEGQLSVFLEDIAAGRLQNVPDSMLKRMQTMKQDAEKTAKESLGFVQKADQNYYEKLHFVVSRPWTLTKPSRLLNLTLVWGKDVYQNTPKKMKLTESASDKCMSELSGVLQGSSMKCGIGSYCVELMTYKGLTGYGITHQIIWTMLAQQAGCIKDLLTVFKTVGYSSLEQFQQEFCTNNFHEMLYMVYGKMGGTIVPKFQDLFLEQQFVCPNIGFHEFLTTEYLDQILAWQRPTGCYGLMPKPKKVLDNSEDAGYDYIDEQGQYPLYNQADVIIQEGNNLVMKSSKSDTKLKFESQSHKLGDQSLLGENAGSNKYTLTGRVQTRHLLAEMVIKNGCLVHKTAVAAGALMMYLRYFLDGTVQILETHRNHSAMAKLSEIYDKGRKVSSHNDRALLGDKKRRTDYPGKNIQNDNKDTGNKKDDYENYPKYKHGEDTHRKMVQIDNNSKGRSKDKNDYNDNDYDDKDYDDYNNDKKDDDYEEDYKKDNKHVKVDDKNDDADYPYYDPNHREEGDSNKDEATRHPLVIRDVDSEPNYHAASTPHISFKTIFLILMITITILLFLMYRFIRTRRIHIKYEIRSLLPI